MNLLKNSVLAMIISVVALNTVQALEVSGGIKRIYATGTNLYVRLKDDTCVTGNGYYRFDMGSEYTQYMAAIILAAANADTSIAIGIESCPFEVDGRVDALYIIQTTGAN